MPQAALLESSTPKTGKRASLQEFGLLLALMLVYFSLVAYCSQKMSAAYDESSHIRAGMTMLSGGRYIDREKAWWSAQDPMLPPSDIFPAGIAWLTGLSPDYRGGPHTPFRYVMAGRIANHLTGALILLIVFFWTRSFTAELENQRGVPLAVTSAVLFNPLFLTHSTIISSDLYMCFGALLCCFFLWRFFASQRHRLDTSGSRLLSASLLLGVLSGFALLCKLSNAIFLIITPLTQAALFVCLWLEKRLPGKTFLQSLKYLSLCLFISIISALLTAGVGYELAQLGVSQTVITKWYIPFGIGEKLANALIIARGLSYILPPVYYYGSLVPGTAFHFMIQFLHRTQVPLIVLLILSLALGAASAFSLRQSSNSQETLVFKRTLLFILSIAVSSFIFFATRGFYVGLRHILFPITLSTLLSAVLFVSKANYYLRWAAYFLVLLTAIAAIQAAPWHISYRNIFAKDELTFVADGDWGQGLLALKDFQEKYGQNTPLYLSYFGNTPPESHGIKYQGLPAPFTPQKQGKLQEEAKSPGRLKGYVALSATHLSGRYMGHIKQPPDFYSEWRSEKPALLLGGSIYLFDKR